MVSIIILFLQYKGKPPWDIYPDMREEETRMRQNIQGSSSSLVGRPVVVCQEVGQLTTEREAESLTKVVTLDAVPSQVMVHTGKEAEAAMVRYPHVL